MATLVEKHVGKCLACQSTMPCHTWEPLQITDLPMGPRKKASVDFAGPLWNKDGFGLFGPVCQVSSRWVYIKYFCWLRHSPIYACVQLVQNPRRDQTDNGPPFNESKFANFAQEQGFRHEKVILGWAEANGDVQHFMQTLKKSARISKLEGKAANAPPPTQLQRKALTCSCSVESSGGSYGKDRTWRRNSIRPNQTKRRS